ncbi:TPA: hypothetical protein ACYUQH_002602 [Klebsiella pneumoniae]|uniref:hypothetical protein n=1 Tax=Klebsiella pneumoniae TaxID=573 RepID=UPI001C963BD4|nr:hypothetical protein [Klebsiella pneumoniae]MBY5153847.1 hypothetical protein [Klebsiella pneumoniae]MBZ7543918.1 hypothetical protein [Klebsiella pneumoniae]HBQ5307961.1 hypothetical protein [Klebsiella pneumoniae]HBQ5447781.1 hypothetical protein [Klebsiella pneumoniae]HCA8483570.1 hypothetical protein [Klebsiella pneumoniae]
MATKIIASELINVVRYQTDRNSLNKVRKQMRQLRQQMENDSVKQSKAEIKRMREQADAEIRETKRAAREKAKAENQGSGKRGGKTQAERDAARQRREQEKALAQQRKAEERAVMQTTNRQAKADHLMKSRSFDINRLQGLNQEQRYNAIREAHRITEEYRNQAITLQQANEALRQQKAILGSIARQNRTQNRRAGVPTPAGHSSRLASSLALAGVAGGVGYGAERAVDTARETLAGSIERNAGRQQLQQYGISPLEADALIQETRARTGKTLTNEQLADQAKDFTEKRGELSLGKWNQAKDGSWSLGSAGEMANLVNAITQRGGKAAGQQVQQNLQGMNYTEYLVYLRQLQKQFKFTDSQMTFFAETVNDGSLALGGIDQTGKNLTDTMMSIARSGQSLTEEQSRNLTYLANLGSVAQSASENLGDSFSAAFAGRMEELGINADATRESFAELKPVMQELGREIGSVTAWISKHLGMIPGTASYNRDTYQQSYQAALDHKNDSPLAQWWSKRWNSTSTAGDAGYQDALAGRPMDQKYVNPYDTPEFVPRDPYADRIAMQRLSLTPQPTPIENNLNMTIQIDPNAGAFSNAFTAQALDVFNNGIDDLTFQVNNMTSNN